MNKELCCQISYFKIAFSNVLELKVIEIITQASDLHIKKFHHKIKA